MISSPPAFISVATDNLYNAIDNVLLHKKREQHARLVTSIIITKRCGHNLLLPINKIVKYNCLIRSVLHHYLQRMPHEKKT